MNPLLLIRNKIQKEKRLQTAHKVLIIKKS